MAGFGLGGKKSNDRLYKGVFGKRPDRYEMRVKEAKERSTFWGNLPLTEQLARLDTRLGVGLGAKKQRARIAKLLEEKKSA